MDQSLLEVLFGLESLWHGRVFQQKGFYLSKKQKLPLDSIKVTFGKLLITGFLSVFIEKIKQLSFEMLKAFFDEMKVSAPFLF